MPLEKLVKLSNKTAERLKTYGKFHETYDEVINKILDEYETLIISKQKQR